MKSAKLLDTVPLARLFKDDAGAARVEHLLAQARRSQTPLLMSEINAGELYYAIARKLGADRAEEVLASLTTIPVTLVPTTWELTLAAARLKAQWAISYADCFAVACAVQEGAVVVTGDPEFKKVEHLVSIEWV